MSLQIQSRPYTTWQLIKAYWRSEQKISAYIFLIVVLIMSMSMVGIDVLLNIWYNGFYDTLQDYNRRSAFDLIWVFLFIAGVYIVLAVYRYYIQSYLGLRWRRWLTEQFLERWLSNRSYYYLENFDKTTDNPDQRIQEDIGLLVTNSLSLFIGIASSLASIFAFIFILWRLSGVLHFHLWNGVVIEVHGYLACIAFIYTAIGTYLTFKIGRPLVKLNFEQQRKEADFRFAAVDLRSHSENVALYRGENQQRGLLDNLMERFLQNWYMIILRQKLLLWFTAGYNQIAIILPLLMAMPNYFNKVFKLGGLLQTTNAFRMVQEALSFLVNSYTQIAEWRAVNQRLITFLNHMYEVEQSAAEQDYFVVRHHDENKIMVDGINLFTPRGGTLLQNIHQEFVHGKNYLIKGVSGIGKSTFVRALAGIWPYGAGEIILPSKAKMMYLPQRTYMPLGTLKDALLFPDEPSSVPDSILIELLNKCGLPELPSQLHDVSMWSQQFSLGELQRIAFVRVLLQQPDWVFLDESTSSLDMENEKRMYELLKRDLPNCSIISLGHRPSLEAYHDVVIDFEKYSLGREVVKKDLGPVVS